MGIDTVAVYSDTDYKNSMHVRMATESRYLVCLNIIFQLGFLYCIGKREEIYLKIRIYGWTDLFKLQRKLGLR